MYSTRFIVLLLLLSFSAKAQIAKYNFNTDFTDSIGSFDATPLNNPVIEQAGYLSIAGESMVTLPTELNADFFANSSIQISFDFYVDENLDENEVYAILISASEPINLPIWEEKGFRLLVDRNAIIFNYGSGDYSANYSWEAVQDIEREKWHNLVLTIDSVNEVFNVQLDGVGTTESFDEFLDFNGFISAVKNNLITIGGTNGTKRSRYKIGFDIDNLTIYNQVQDQADQVNDFFQELIQVLNGELSLSDQYIKEGLDNFETNAFFIDYSDVVSVLMNYSQLYEEKNPPLYEDETQYNKYELPVMGRALQVAQSFIFQQAYVADQVENMQGVVFEHHEVAPGAVKNNTARVPNATVDVNGTYNVDIAAQLTDQSRVVRPTGYYVAAGDLVTITVPQSAVNTGLSIIVGSHFRNMDYDYIGSINRFPDISAEFPVQSTQMTVANPFGGGIYLKVPDGTNVGWFEMTIQNAIKSPYFSYRAGRKTDVNAWLQEVANTGAPWADFESDKFMFTIPIEEVKGITKPDEIMARWDEIMDAIRLVGGRPVDRPRAEYYSFDTRLVTPAYGAGYPVVIPTWEMRGDERWNPLTVLDTPPNSILFHEMGHNHLQPTLDFGPDFYSCWYIEAETIVHMLAFSVYNNVYGMDMNTAFSESGTWTKFDFNDACFDWIISSNFRQGLPMLYDEQAPMEDKEMLKYQFRGWAKYGDIARLYGWEGLSAVNGAFYTANEQAVGTVCEDRPFIIGRDEYIKAACEALGENVTPLFHFWGINPSDSLAKEMEQYPKSQKVKALIEKYRCEVAPTSYDDYLLYHDRIHPRADYQQPRYDLYIREFDNSYVTAIQNQFDFVLTTYGLDGPASPSNVTYDQMGSAITLEWEDNATNESGYYIKQRQLPSGTFEVIKTVSANATSELVEVKAIGSYEFQVVAFNQDGLESNTCETKSLQVTVNEITTSSEIVMNDGLVEVFPNPASDQIVIENNTDGQLKQMTLFDITGRVRAQWALKNMDKQQLFILPNLSSGIYIVKIWDQQDRLRNVKLIVE
ncbi:MAG: M60 family peptidase N-terminal accessory domain-containing protein [Bacteroidota bacterium]